MASSQGPPGSKPGPGHGKAKTRRSKRIAALAKQQKNEAIRKVAKLELQQALGDEKAEHDATKAVASRLRLQHNDLVTRLDEAETAVANAESRAWNSEREIVKLQESLSVSRQVAQNNEAYIGLMAGQNQQLEEANARIVARTAGREGELRREVEVMENRSRQLEQSLSKAYKDVEEYGVLFQKNTEDWAELVKFLDEHKAEDGDRIQELRASVVENYNAMDCFQDEANKLFQAAEVRIARNRLRSVKAAKRASLNRVQWDGQVSRPSPRSSSKESLHRSSLFSESPESDSDSSPNPGDFAHVGIQHEGLSPPCLVEDARTVPTRRRTPRDSYIELANDQGSLISLAPLVHDIQGGFATFNINRICRCPELACGGHGFDLGWDRHLYNNQGWGSYKEQIAHDSSSPEATDNESSLGRSWSIPSLSSDPTSLSGSNLSNLSFESWNYAQEQQEPIRIDQPRTEIDWSRLKSSSGYYEHLSHEYTPTLNTSRKRVRLAPPPSDPCSDIEDEELASIEPTDCEIPPSLLNTQIVNNDLTVGNWQGNSILRSKAIQTDKALLPAHSENLGASSSQALAVTPNGPLGAGGKLRSLSAGDLPQVLSGEGGAAFERMPGSWPLEVISHADVNPRIALELADAASQLFSVSIKKLLHLMNPAHPQCIVYPGLMVLWIWQTYEDHVEWKRWERANSFTQQLRSRYALQIDWVDSVGYGVSQWLAFDRASFG